MSEKFNKHLDPQLVAQVLVASVLKDRREYNQLTNQQISEVTQVIITMAKKDSRVIPKGSYEQIIQAVDLENFLWATLGIQVTSAHVHNDYVRPS